MNPFHFKPGTLLSISGGRTSGYVLWRTLQENGGTLPPGVIPVFANTGKEFPQTLDFVREMGERFGCHIYWVEFDRIVRFPLVTPEADFYCTDYDNASRDGEPFKRLIRQKRYIPNSAHRICSEWLKTRTIRAFMERLGYYDFTTVLGIRADEPRRIAKIKARIDEGEDILLPLVEAGIGEGTIFGHWRNSPFTVDLPEGISNCDNCFLKGVQRVEYNLRKKPESGVWWSDREDEEGATFFKGVSFRQLMERAEQWRNHPALPLYPEEQQIACFCTD